MQPRSIQAYVGFKSGSQLLPFVSKAQRNTLNQAVDSSVSRAKSSSATRRQVTKMPIGVPKVPYKSPRDGGWQWVDLWNCLYRERIIFLSQPVNEVICRTSRLQRLATLILSGEHLSFFICVIDFFIFIITLPLTIIRPPV